MPTVYYAAAPEGQAGPMTEEELLAAVAAGRFPSNVQVWWPESPDWVPLDRLNLQHVAPLQPARPADEQHDRLFAALVKDSWKHHHLVDDTTRVDDVLLGALITAGLDTGHVLIDLESDGTNHFVRFEDPSDRSRLTMAITHLTGDVTEAKTVGQRASVVFGYGEPIKSFSNVISAMKQEAKSGYLMRAEPGIVSFDADAASQYVYAQVDLYLDLDKYISADLVPDYAALDADVAATMHALRKFLHGRIGD